MSFKTVVRYNYSINDIYNKIKITFFKFSILCLYKPEALIDRFIFNETRQLFLFLLTDNHF